MDFVMVINGHFSPCVSSLCCEALPEKSPLRTIAKYVKCVDKVDKELKTAEVIKLVLSTDYTLIYDLLWLSMDTFRAGKDSVIH